MQLGWLKIILINKLKKIQEVFITVKEKKVKILNPLLQKKSTAVQAKRVANLSNQLYLKSS